MWPSKGGPSTKSLDPAGAAREKHFPTRPLNTYHTTSTDDTVLPMQGFSDQEGTRAGWPEEPDRIYPGFGSERPLHSGRVDERWVEEQVWWNGLWVCSVDEQEWPWWLCEQILVRVVRLAQWNLHMVQRPCVMRVVFLVNRGCGRLQKARVAFLWMSFVEPHGRTSDIMLSTPQPPRPWPLYISLMMQRHLAKAALLCKRSPAILYRNVIVLCPCVRCARSYSHCQLHAWCLYRAAKYLSQGPSEHLWLSHKPDPRDCAGEKRIALPSRSQANPSDYRKESTVTTITGEMCLSTARSRWVQCLWSPMSGFTMAPYMLGTREVPWLQAGPLSPSISTPSWILSIGRTPQRPGSNPLLHTTEFLIRMGPRRYTCSLMSRPTAQLHGLMSCAPWSRCKFDPCYTDCFRTYEI